MNQTIITKKLIKEKSKIDNKFINFFIAISIIIPLATLGFVLTLIQNIFIIIYTCAFIALFVTIGYFVRRSNKKKSEKLDNNEIVIHRERLIRRYSISSSDGTMDSNISRGTSYYYQTAKHDRIEISRSDYNKTLPNDYIYIIETDNGKYLYAFPNSAYELDGELKYMYEKTGKRE